jgi:hypothetical protein
MTRPADFQVIEYSARLSGGAGEGQFLKAYTPFDKKLVTALKNRTNATFFKDPDGRCGWKTSASSKHADEFRKLIAEAATRTNGTPIPSITPNNLAHHMYDRSGALFG